MYMEINETLRLIGIYMDKIKEDLKEAVKEDITELNEFLVESLCTCKESKDPCPVHNKKD